MSLGIIRDDLDQVIDRLKDEDFDDTEFPNSLYQTDYKLSIDQEDILLIPGTQVGPVAEYVVKHGDSDWVYDDSPPGILPYVNGAFQIKGGSPSPSEVGIPLFSNERMGKIGIRWLFRSTQSRSNDGLTDWERLTEDEVEDLPSRVKPEEQSIKSSRSGKDPSPRITYPESVELVESRKDDYWWECWCARAQELMDTWRVLVPNTAKNPLPTLLGPENTLVADNFNVVIQPDGETAVALAAVLSTETAQDFLREISPWSKGDTPRPRVKHVAATIHQNRGIVETVLDEKDAELEELKNGIHQFHEDTLGVLRKYVEGSSSGDTTLRDRYTSISDQDKLNSEITGVSAGNSQQKLDIGTEDGDVTVEFHDTEYAASMAIAVWLSAGFGDTVDDTLEIQTVTANLDAVESILYNKEFNNFCQTIEADYF
jgi:hypothetical protein